MIIAVEGLDGAGKTTISSALARKLNAAYIKLPPSDLMLAEPDLFARHESLARYLYYLSAAASVAETARFMELVVADRYIASAHAMHAHVGGEAADLLRRLPFTPPDLTIYLDVDEETRRARLVQRGRPLDAFEKELGDNDVFRSQVVAHLKSMPETHVISTSNRRPEEVVDEAVKIWRLRIGGGTHGGPEF